MERFDGEPVEVYDDNLVFLDDLSGRISVLYWFDTRTTDLQYALKYTIYLVRWFYYTVATEGIGISLYLL